MLALKLCILIYMSNDIVYCLRYIIKCIYSFIVVLLISYSVGLFIILFLSVGELLYIYTFFKCYLKPYLI